MLSASTRDIEKACRNAAEVYLLDPTSEAQRAHIDLLKAHYLWARNTGDVERALSIAREVGRNAVGEGVLRDRGEAFDEQGTCLRLLGRFKESEAAHRYAIRIARQTSADELQKNASSNLGLLLQQTSRPTAAIRYFDRALSGARARRNHAAEAAIDLNRALALLDVGRLDSAEA
jgi:tetratricopeptide (TPR) repeat protein